MVCRPGSLPMVEFAAGTTFDKALHFFVYDAPKILVLLAVAIFVITIIRSYFPPHKTKKYLSHKRTIFGNVLAALVGIMTPFCSCSAVPLFIGFIEAGVPLGVTFSLLISSPMINEIALVLLKKYNKLLNIKINKQHTLMFSRPFCNKKNCQHQI